MSDNKGTARHRAPMGPYSTLIEAELGQRASVGMLADRLEKQGRHVRDDYEERDLRALRARIYGHLGMSR